MKKHLPLVLVCLMITAMTVMGWVVGAQAAGAPSAQAPDSDEGVTSPAEPGAGEGPGIPLAPENLYTIVTIEPGVSLPNGDPALTCFDIPVNLDAAATVVDVGVTVAYTHTWVGDLTYQLHAPDGEHLTMMNRPGHPATLSGDSSNLTADWPLTFSNAATDSAENMGSTLDTNGTICQDDGRCHYFPAPDGDLDSMHSFAQMVGKAASGAWQFCASDTALGDTGPLEAVTLTLVYHLPQVAACTTSDWQTVASLNTPRSRPGVVYSEARGNFYTLGGETSGGDRELAIEEYDAASDTWTDKSHLLTGVSNTGAAAVGDYIYVPGGYDGTSGVATMQRFDPLADVVTMVAPMPAANYAHAVTALDGKIYVLGGWETGTAGTTNYIYDVASNTWDSGAPLPTAVHYPAAATDGVYIYVLGGNVADLATVQRYDPASDSWEMLPDMNRGRGGAAAFFDGENVWAVNGGWSAPTATTEYWDGVEWKTGPPTNGVARTLGAAFGDGMAMKAGGWNDAYVAQVEVMQIDCSAPHIEAHPGAITEAAPAGQAVTRMLTIGNTGGAELQWSALEAAPLGAPPLGAATLGAAPRRHWTVDAEPEADADRGLSLAEAGEAAADAAPGDEALALDFPVSPAGGGLLFYADRGQFDDDNPGLPLEDFEDSNVPDGGVRTCPPPADENSNNLCFDAGDILPGILFQNDKMEFTTGLALAGAGFNGSPSRVLVTQFEEHSLEIYFTAPDVYAVGMDLHAFNTPSTLEMTIYGWDGVTVLGETTAAGTVAGVFWGVTSQAPIGRIAIYSPTDKFEGVDNIAFGYTGVCSTPEEMPWLNVSPANGAIAPGASQEVTLTLDSTGLEPGDMVQGTLCLNSNDPNQPHVEIPVSLTVEDWELYLPVFMR